jgi:hypothetical protein
MHLHDGGAVEELLDHTVLKVLTEQYCTLMHHPVRRVNHVIGGHALEHLLRQHVDAFKRVIDVNRVATYILCNFCFVVSQPQLQNVATSSHNVEVAVPPPGLQVFFCIFGSS